MFFGFLPSSLSKLGSHRLRHDTFVEDRLALEWFLICPDRPVDRAPKNEDHDFAQTKWSGVLSSEGAE